MRIAICPGSFDPITNGHLDIIRRAAKLFDHVEVAVLQNSSKKCVFSVEERVEMIRDCIAELPNVSASSFDGLLVDYAKKKAQSNELTLSAYISYLIVKDYKCDDYNKI